MIPRTMGLSEKEKCMRFCRLCSQSADDGHNRSLKPLTTEASPTLKDLYSISVNPNDDLPKATCKNCSQRDNIVNRFEGTVQDTEKYLSHNTSDIYGFRKNLGAKQESFTAAEKLNKARKNAFSSSDTQYVDLNDAKKNHEVQTFADVLEARTNPERQPLARLSNITLTRKSLIKQSPKSRLNPQTLNTGQDEKISPLINKNIKKDIAKCITHSSKNFVVYDSQSFFTNVPLKGAADQTRVKNASLGYPSLAPGNLCGTPEYCFLSRIHQICATGTLFLQKSNQNTVMESLYTTTTNEVKDHSSPNIRMPTSKVTNGSKADELFDTFKNEELDLLPVGKFLAALKKIGIRGNDPRIRDVTQNLLKLHREVSHEGGSPETLKLDRTTFKEVVASNILLINRAFQSQFVIPDFQEFVNDLEEIYWITNSNTDGKVATYIPQLARASPDSWGVSVCTTDGQRYSIGDVLSPFTIQSCSKPLTYAMALETLGPDVVHSYVGTEPSGRHFNEIVLDHNMKPHNPMINAGAILICTLLKELVMPEMTLAEKFDYVMSYFSRIAANESFGFNNAVFLSEREAADRNYALGFYMRENKCFPEDTNLRECMDFYFQNGFKLKENGQKCMQPGIPSNNNELYIIGKCCSMEANCEIMSVVAATLANGGICPLTNEKVLRPETVRNVLSLMHSCGMYDYSGQFAFKVGLPAKSGVAGALIVVVPNVMGFCTWSPPLDPLGNSCRGLQFCDELVKRFNFHKYDDLRYATHKKDPRKYKFESKYLDITNLVFSAANGDLSSLKRFHLSGMNMSLADYDGRTALHLAAAEGHLNCVEFLLTQCGVDHAPCDRWGSRPLDDAKTFKHQNVVAYLEGWQSNRASVDLENGKTVIVR